MEFTCEPTCLVGSLWAWIQRIKILIGERIFHVVLTRFSWFDHWHEKYSELWLINLSGSIASQIFYREIRWANASLHGTRQIAKFAEIYHVHEVKKTIAREDREKKMLRIR